MGKHGNEYRRVERDLYQTPAWAVDALAEHIELARRTVWEPAAGDGQMVAALRAHGASVHASDAYRYRGLDEILDFTAERRPKIAGYDIVTNPPFGSQGRLAVAFIEAGLRRTERRGSLALLLPVDFDSAVTRQHLFADCPRFAGKIVLLDRIVWFARADGVKEAPKENSCWFLWSHDPDRTVPAIMYARTRAPRPNQAVRESRPTPIQLGGHPL